MSFHQTAADQVLDHFQNRQQRLLWDRVAGRRAIRSVIIRKLCPHYGYDTGRYQQYNIIIIITTNIIISIIYFFAINVKMNCT